MEPHPIETPLARILKSLIQHDGPMTFRDFMQAALYHPVYGFYTQGPRIGTADGAFHTNANFQPFAFSLAQWMIQAQHLLGESLRIIELGAGTGQLAERILSWLPEILHNYVIVEPSEGLRTQQTRRGLHVVSDLSALSHAPTLVFANEVLDALPFHRVMGDGKGGIQELFVGLDHNGEFVERFDQPSTPQLHQHLASMAMTLGRGQLAEINLDVSTFMQDVTQVMSKGYLLFIDYGAHAHVLYGHERRNGTLRCFKEQREVFDPFDYVGEQDLTADVNWTAVEQAADKNDLVKVGLVSQGTWLQKIGIAHYAEHVPQDTNALAEITCLTKGSLLGSTFDVLGFKTPGLPDAPGFSYPLSSEPTDVAQTS
ncbi:MAG: hypothetical protein GKS05_09250 [Nitrospirales bacterium]|nr:hypothetical protein [Nitrospirales bacterium]